MTMKAGKGITDVDREIGRRVRTARLIAGLSQEKLGEALGVTFQQIQKYEKATNRMGPTALTKAAAACQTTVAYLMGINGTTNISQLDETTRVVSETMATPEGVHLVQAFAKIESPALRRSIVNMVQQISA